MTLTTTVIDNESKTPLIEPDTGVSHSSILTTLEPNGKAGTPFWGHAADTHMFNLLMKDDAPGSKGIHAE